MGRSHVEDVRALAEAVADASHWAAAASNWNSLVALLISIAGHKVSAGMIERILAKPASPSGPALTATGLRLDEDAIKADPSRALWLYAQMAAAGQTVYSAARPRPRPPSTLRLSGRRSPVPPPLPLHSTDPRFRQTILPLTSRH